MKTLNRITLSGFNLTLFLFICAMLVSSTVIAQGKAAEKKAAGGDEFTLEEITVTAEFREKAIQDTPLSITAVSADKLQMRDEVRLDQIALEAPNVSLRPGNASYGSSMVAYIRGIGQTDFNPSVEAGVGIYVDDVYYSTITGNLLDLLDLDRVEILRGPQGTLAGRNALGGAIKLFSKKPDDSGDGYLEMTYGSLDRLDIKAAGDFVITDKLFARVAGVSHSRDGYITSYDYACYNNLPAPGNPGGFPTYIASGNTKGKCQLAKEGGQSMTAGRLSLRWVPNDDFEINLATNIVNDKSESQPSVLFSNRNMATQGDPIPIFYDNNGNGVYDVGIDVPYDSRFVTAGTYMNYSTYIDAGVSTPSPLFQGGVPGENVAIYKPNVMPRINHLDSRDYTLTVDWNLTSNVSLKSITAYRKYTNIFADDNDGSPLAIQQLLQRMYHRQFTQEIRLNSTLFDGFADTTLGVFYLDEETDEDARVNLNYVGFDFMHGPDRVPAKSKAVYGQGTMHLTDRTDLTLGARYSKDEKSYTFQRHNPDGSNISPLDPTILFDIGQHILGLPPGIVLGPFPFDANQPANVLLQSTNGQSASYSSTRFDYRGAINYNFTDKIMGYFQIATGYRAGGNNARPFYPSQINTFKPETLTNYEIGIKSTLFDQLRLNASAFYNDYKDIQLPLASCYFAPAGEQSPCASQDNVGDGEIKGFELEGLWRPTTNFSLDFSYSYLDFKYTHIKTYVNDLGETVPVSNADTTPYTPKNKWSAGAQYRLDLGRWGDLTYRLDAAYQGDVETAGIVGQGEVIKAYTLFNGRVVWRSEDLKWEVAFEETNLTNKYYYLTIFDLEDSMGSIFKNAQPGPPRECAITVKRTWYFK